MLFWAETQPAFPISCAAPSRAAGLPHFAGLRAPFVPLHGRPVRVSALDSKVRRTKATVGGIRIFPIVSPAWNGPVCNSSALRAPPQVAPATICFLGYYLSPGSPVRFPLCSQPRSVRHFRATHHVKYIPPSPYAVLDMERRTKRDGDPVGQGTESSSLLESSFSGSRVKQSSHSCGAPSES